ncbi:LppP/LprE family lipoprotein [Nocardia sp. NPDC127526]|uniref:LppP/LprE family lipoprotein n=1 Tax=Nocardia sp. NPDC127526 TaxID=3345393 RepID=UPI00362CB59F
MRIKPMVFAALVTGIVAGVSGCGTTVSNPVSAPSPSRSTTAAAPEENPGGETPAGNQGGDAVESQQPTVAPVTANPAPNGSGHGFCFDLNSQLANDAVSRLAVPATGPWRIESASDDPISQGCAGTLSWMTVLSGDIHPYLHILYFADGEWLGTATAEPYGYTKILGKTKDTVRVQYQWLTADEPLCCPQGGPSVVSFTLAGGKIQASGQFPPER